MNNICVLTFSLLFVFNLHAQDFDCVGGDEESCYVLKYSKPCYDWQDPSDYVKWDFTNVCDCLKFYKRNVESYPGSWQDENCQLNVVKMCQLCDSEQEKRKKKNISDKKDNIIYDEYDPSIGFKFNEETGEYEQITLGSDEELTRQKAEEEELKKIEKTKKQQEIIEHTAEDIFNAVEQHKTRKEDFKEARNNVKGESLPIIEEDNFNTNTSNNDFTSISEDNHEINNDLDLGDMADNFSSYLKTASKTSIVIGSETTDNFVGTAKDVFNNIKTGLNAYEVAQNPNDIKAQGRLFEDAIGYTAKAAGSGATGVRQFSPPVNLWNQTYGAVLKRGESLISGESSSEIDVWAPTLNYMGKITNTGSIGNIIKDYRWENVLSWKELKKKHGTIEGTKRKILYHFIGEDF